MGLRITLKPNERVVVGGAVVRNVGPRATSMSVENRVPLLREKDILGAREATTPCRRIYFAIQLMYIDGGRAPRHLRNYRRLCGDVLRAAPSTLPLLEQVDVYVRREEYYRALRETRALIDYESRLTRHAEEAR
jgi:flagellar protein FlbT